jgi:hypothetical protein
MKRWLNPSQLQEQSNFHAIWPSAVILAEAEREDFVNVEVITSSAYNKEIAFEQSCNIGGDLSEIETRTRAIEQSLSDVEFIEVLDDKIRVCLSVDRVDDRVMDHAMQLIGDLESFEVGSKVLLNEPHASNH